MDMKLVTLSSLLVVFASFCWQNAAGTCILDSDFGFTLNCGFKKSGLFRVKNLGGVKGFLGLGFSVGDELGFPQSLSTTDVDAKRRSVQGVRGNSIGVKSANDADADADADVAMRSRKALSGVQTVTSVNGVKRNKSSARSISTGRSRTQTARNIAIPPFKPILPASLKYPSYPALQHSQHKMSPTPQTSPNITRPQRLAYAGALQTVNAPSLGGVVVPPFQALPASITKLTSIANSKSASLLGLSQAQAFRNSLQAATSHFQVRKDVVSPVYDHGLTDNTLTLRTLSSSASQQQLLPSDHAVQSSTASPPASPSAEAPLPSTSSAYQLKPDDTLMGHSIKALAQASNLSIEAITAAIAIRQQQLLKQQQQAPPTTTTLKPVTLPSVNTKKYPLSSVSKVMNAPKEYYPVGYDKNFDDNFASRVELPETSFYCGDQKHFPGLYADEDLGCMVFHVCAFTDDGLIMKSFLCPESTLFDQTILKCNWWFYTDCKTSAKLYDSNIPISKSYQLMKALAFFSSYGKKS